MNDFLIMTMFSLKKLLLKFFESNVSTLITIILYFCFLATMLEHNIVKRRSAIEMLGPHPNGIVKKIKDIYYSNKHSEDSFKRGRCSVYVDVADGDYSESKRSPKAQEYLGGFTMPVYPTTTPMSTIAFNEHVAFQNMQTKQEKIIIHGNFTSLKQPHYQDIVFSNESIKEMSQGCIVDFIVANFMHAGRLILSVGDKSSPNDFLGYDIMQAAAIQPILRGKYREIFPKKIILYEVVIGSLLALGRFIVHKL